MRCSATSSACGRRTVRGPSPRHGQHRAQPAAGPAAGRKELAGARAARSAVLVEAALEQTDHRFHRGGFVLAVDAHRDRSARPAASSITPMMLLALISRPLAAMVTLQRNGAVVCTSLAVARACRPRRLLTVSSRSSIVDYRSITGARRGCGGQLIQSLFRIIHHPQQHRQAQRRYPANRVPNRASCPAGLAGLAPYRSVRISTPSPASTRRRAAEASGSRASVSASNGTSKASVFSGNCRRSRVATSSRAGPTPDVLRGECHRSLLHVNRSR